MPITINRTTVSTNSINGTSINSETVNGTQVYVGAGSVKEWSFYGYNSSEPPVSVIVSNHTSSVASATSYWLEAAHPAANFSIGNLGAIYYSVPRLYAVFVIRSV